MTGKVTDVSSPSGEELAEWRCSQQVENGTPSTSPPYWDSDENDDEGPRPSDLFVKFTYKIDEFSKQNKRELRSDKFKVGDYEWYILVYPQGCDVCNHLSLFLCVANHDKLLPGWSHFAQFTIAVVNKDPKKSKYSDTLHRFWKKEHDWGWKKFMELSKALDGFIDADSLTIKAQVQVIRERPDRPFRCLDCNYRRELIRVYLTNVEDTCRRCLEVRRSKLAKVISDKARWSSFRAFWLTMDQDVRRHMCRDKAESVLKSVVKDLFLEKEVTSTLVMDSLYSGLKALEGQSTEKKSKALVFREMDSFVLVDDVIPLLHRAAHEPLPPKDEKKGPQDRKKAVQDGTGGDEYSKDSIEGDERRLTELGRRTIEIFALDHIFSKIDDAHKEAVSLRRQEELIREEEAAEIEHKAKRGVSDKKSKKKQGKQKKNKAKGKDKGKDEKHASIVENNDVQDATLEREDLAAVESEMTLEQSDILQDVSDVSDFVDCVPEILAHTERSVDSFVAWDNYTSELTPPVEGSSSDISALSGIINGREVRSPSVGDDSSSTCSLDSVPSVVVNVPNGADSDSLAKNHKSSTGVKTNESTLSSDNQVGEEGIRTSGTSVQLSDAFQSSMIVKSASQDAAVSSLHDRIINGSADHVVKEELEVGLTHQSLSSNDRVELSGDPATCASHLRDGAPSELQFPVKHRSSVSDSPNGRSVSILNSAEAAVPTERLSTVSSEPVENRMSSVVEFASSHLSGLVSRPGPTPVVSMVRTAAPVVASSVSTAGQLDPVNTSSCVSASQSYVPNSYRNAAIMGGGGNRPILNAVSSVSPYPSQAPLASTPTSAAMFPPQQSSDLNPVQPSFPFRMANQPESGHLWMNQDSSTDSFVGDQQSLYDNNSFNPLHNRRLPSRQQAHVPVTDEFPHLDIINDLLDDDYGTGSSNSLLDQNLRNGSPYLIPTNYQENNSTSRMYYDTLPDMISPQPYMNGADVFVPAQWRMPSVAPVVVGHNLDSNFGYQYHQHQQHHHFPGYPNVSVGANGYRVFRSSNGL